MDTKQRIKFKRFIRTLEKVKGRHTELVSVYVPAGYDLNKIISHLSQEQHTASNIKDAKTRGNVIDSLERCIRHLRLFKKTPEHGLALFAGNASKSDNKTDIQVWSIEPQDELKTRIYRCDQKFLLEPLLEMMESKEIYALIVMDRREATIGLLKGTSIKKIAHMTSNVPGKYKTGGYCLHPDTLIQLNDGNIIKIKDSHNPYIVKSVDFKTNTIKDSNITDKWETEKKQAYKIITQCPRLEINSSKDHTFFIFDKGIKEKSVKELQIGDHLIMPEKIDVKGQIQKLSYKKNYKYNIKSNIILPTILNKNLAQILGYFIGDGYAEVDRLNFYERDKQVAYFYKKKIDSLFNINSTINFKKHKNYYETRTYGRPIVNLIKNEFPEAKKSYDSEVPKKILKSKDPIIAAFLRGLFDAEGYTNKDELALGMSNKLIIQQIHFLLLRLGIIASICEYDIKKKNINIRYTLRITDKPSLEIFQKTIGFTFKDKKLKLNKLIKQRTNKNNMRQVLVSGSEIRKIIKKAGLVLPTNFPKVANFFWDQRQMSKYIFNSSILSQIKDKKLHNQLKKVLEHQIIPVKIKSIEKSKEKINMIDISVKNQNFIANGVIVHNSQQRYARIRELKAKEFYNRIGDIANKEFLMMKELKGILVGGPGNTKKEFVDGDHMNNNIRKKVIAIKDMTYTGEFGLRELLDKCKDVLKKELVAREKEIVNKLLEMLAKTPEKVTYGEKEVKKTLDMGAVQMLLISEALDDEKIEEFEEAAEKIGTEVTIISEETQEGIQLKNLGKIAAILRYAI